MVRALARHVANRYSARGHLDVEIRAESFAALNGRPLQRLIDPRVDLAGSTTADWIVPLKRGLGESAAIEDSPARAERQ